MTGKRIHITFPHKLMEFQRYYLTGKMAYETYCAEDNNRIDLDRILNNFGH